MGVGTGMVQRARAALPRLWRAVPGIQWRALHLTQPTFLVGVCAMLSTEDGRLLLVKNAFWPEGQQWGMPSGYLEPNESLAQCVMRELAEEIGGGTVEGIRVLDMSVGYRMRVEVLLEGTVSDLPSAHEHESLEVLGHRLVTMDALPAELHDGHREKLARRRRRDDGATGRGEGAPAPGEWPRAPHLPPSPRSGRDSSCQS